MDSVNPIQSGMGGVQQGMGESQQGQSGPYLLQNRDIIWRGQLEWQDKKAVPLAQSCRITRSLGCIVSLSMTDPDINTSKWPTTLIMQLMPQTLLNSHQLNPFLKNSRQVAFHFHNNDIDLDPLRNLYKVMCNGFAGCVHFPHNSASGIRLLLLLFSNKRKCFVGFIPNDQRGVVNGIRQVITQLKMRGMDSVNPTSMGQNPMQSGMGGVQQGMGSPQQGQPVIANPDQPGPNMLQNWNIIWRGQIEWQDKKTVPPAPSAIITRSLGCIVSISMTDPDIKTLNWPTTLIMQLMPQTLLNSHQLNPLFKNSRQVECHFHNNDIDPDHLRNLYKVMDNEFAGCVHFPHNAASGIRVMLLLFSNKRKCFVGLIPNDQSGVVNVIRQLITQHKMRMLQMQQDAGTQPPIEGPEGMQQPGMVGMVPGAGPAGTGHSKQAMKHRGKESLSSSATDYDDSVQVSAVQNKFAQLQLEMAELNGSS